MNFLQPTYLWAFAGLLVPLAIHLLSRKEGRVIKIGSIRHIRETPTRQFRSVRLNEYLLLFLRCLLLGGMVLLMSGWYMEGIRETHQWLVIEPGLENRPGLKGLMDSLAIKGYEQRFLSRDFPESPVSAATPDYYSLLEDLQKRSVDAVVIATNNASGFLGPRMTLPENIKWIEVAPEAHQGIIRQVQLRHDSIWERRGSFSAVASQFTNYRRPADGTKVGLPDTVRIVVAYDPEFETDKEIIVASVEAIKRELPEIVSVKAVLAGAYSGSSPEWLVWLSTAEPPSGAKSTVRFADKPLSVILEPVGEQKYLLTARLNSEVAVRSNLAVHLMKVLFPDDQASAQDRRYDRRVVSAQAAFGGPSTLRLRSWQAGSGTVSVVGKEADQSSTRYIAIALLVLLALERAVAYQRMQ